MFDCDCDKEGRCSDSVFRSKSVSQRDCYLLEEEKEQHNLAGEMWFMRR